MPIAPSPAVLRACDVLDHLAAHPSESFSVSEVARAVGVPRATCDAVLLALAEGGLVRRDADLRYGLGEGCRALGEAAAVSGAPLSVLESVAELLARSVASCVAISSRIGLETRVERVYDHGPAFGIRARVGESMSLVPPFGAVFVAWDGDAAIEAWLDRAAVALSDDDRAATRDALAAVRARRYSISTASVRPDLVRMLEELVDDDGNGARRDARAAFIREVPVSEYLAVSVAPNRRVRLNHMAAPVFDADGTVVYAFMVLGPGDDLSGREITALGERLVAAADEGTTRIRGRRP